MRLWAQLMLRCEFHLKFSLKVIRYCHNICAIIAQVGISCQEILIIVCRVKTFGYTYPIVSYIETSSSMKAFQ